MLNSKSLSENSEHSDNTTFTNSAQNSPDQSKTVSKVTANDFIPLDDDIQEDEIPF